MKMAKSTTQNASNESFDVEKIRRFTQQELQRLNQSSSELPICYQLGTSVLVGSYKVRKISDKCWRVSEADTDIFDFLNRKDAIFYCIAMHKKQYKLANSIKDSDSVLNKLEFDAALYRIRYKKAQKNNDQWATEFYSVRYQETMERISKTKKEIRKNLELAKYLKL